MTHTLTSDQAKRVNGFYRSALETNKQFIANKEQYLSQVNKQTVDFDYLALVEQQLANAKNDTAMIESIIKATEA